MKGFDLSGKTIWVVGGAGYFGQSITKLLCHQGGNVLCADLGDKAAAFVSAHPRLANVVPVTCDITNTEALPGWIEAHLGSCGRPHGLVILSYFSTGKKLADLTPGDFDAATHSNLTATFVFAREVARHMASAGEGGSIVLFSSMYGSVSPDPGIYESPMNPNPIEYGVCKAGILQMTRYLAVHYGARNIRVNAVSPGPFPHPPMQRDSPAFMERLARKNPLGRIGREDEVAGSVAFLLSDAASYVTGINLPVDGGWTIW